MVSSSEDRNDDSRAMANTELRLAQHNPAVAPEVIHTLVQRSYHRLTPAKVHDYLPVLVSREVQATLRRRHAG
jgi:hypothetical protein